MYFFFLFFHLFIDSDYLPLIHLIFIQKKKKLLHKHLDMGFGFEFFFNLILIPFLLSNI